MNRVIYTYSSNILPSITSGSTFSTLALAIFSAGLVSNGLFFFGDLLKAISELIRSDNKLKHRFNLVL